MQTSLKGVVCLIAVACASCAAPPAGEFQPETIVALERAALERWGKGDPSGYFELFAPEMTYFDPTTAARIDGRDALVAMLKPYTGKIFVGRFDMQQPLVQRRGDTAVLTFNLLSYRAEPGQKGTGQEGTGQERVVARWNATEVYSRIDGAWKLTHSHWSYIKPELKVAVTEVQ